MPLGDTASDVIRDFVHSSDKRFKGKSKAERIRMALGAFYGKRISDRIAILRQIVKYGKVYDLVAERGIGKQGYYVGLKHPEKGIVHHNVEAGNRRGARS